MARTTIDAMTSDAMTSDAMTSDETGSSSAVSQLKKTPGRTASWRGLGVAVACAVTAAVGYAAFSGGDTDLTARVLARGYGQALADVDTSWTSAHSGKDAAKASGNLWLSGLSEQPMPMRKAVVVGDRITVGNTTRSDVFEVVALGQIDGEPLGLPTMRIQVVTARLDGQAAEGQAPGETVRFLFAVDDLRPVPAQPKPDKVL